MFRSTYFSALFQQIKAQREPRGKANSEVPPIREPSVPHHCRSNCDLPFHPSGTRRVRREGPRRYRRTCSEPLTSRRLKQEQQPRRRMAAANLMVMSGHVRAVKASPMGGPRPALTALVGGRSESAGDSRSQASFERHCIQAFGDQAVTVGSGVLVDHRRLRTGVTEPGH